MTDSVGHWVRALDYVHDATDATIPNPAQATSIQALAQWINTRADVLPFDKVIQFLKIIGGPLEYLLSVCPLANLCRVRND